METVIREVGEGLKEGADIIKCGGVVAFPTETVYGLGANAFDETAVKKIFEAKGRPQDNPLIVHISSIDDVKTVAKDIPDEFYLLAEKFMPGPLTVILKKGDRIPYTVTAGGETVGVRMPNNAYARELIRLSFPIAAPSANASKHISPTTAMHVYEDLQGRIPLILDGGSCAVGIESTVLDLTGDEPTILRPGAVTQEMLMSVLGTVGSSNKVMKIAKAPGMKYTHYAPKVEARCFISMENALTEYDRLKGKGLKPVIIARDIYGEMVGTREFISLGATLQDYANRVYSALHDAEKTYDYILIEHLSGGGLATSIMNRVEKSAGGRFID